jgi:large subunit ribosomal protein L15
MQKHELKSNNRKPKTRVGRGGKRGKTSGKGHKGQKARTGNSMRPEMRDVIKRFPKMRGRGVNSNKSIKPDSKAINLTVLEKNFSDNEIVNPRALFKKNLMRKVSGKLPVVKILSNGEISKKIVIVGCLISKAAQEKIEKIGGKVILK